MGTISSLQATVSRSKFRALVITAFLSIVCSAPLHAAMQSFSFYKLTNNNVEDLAGQLSITVWDSAGANTEFGLSLLSTEVLFTVHNAVGIASNIAEVYFDDGLLGPSTVINSLGGFTDFDGGGASPGNLPGGNTATPAFIATSEFSADVNPGPPSRGVNESADILGIVLGLGSFADYNAIIGAVNTGDLRFGYHIRSIGSAGGSDSYINTVVPLPAALWLFLSALLGLRLAKKTH